MTMIEKAEHARFHDMLKVYEEEVTRWYISASDQLNSYVRRIHLLEDQRDTAMMLMDSYQKEAINYRLLVESARQAEIKLAKQSSVSNWAQWSAAERKIL
jgi:DNA polymerase III delta prime subunit